ncbi:MAG: DUF1344 domain-containing protein [Rhizobiaceae bacterium]|nr:DUF1344 domain-containing protein [Rhizobiaceae bacterium]
MRTLLIPAAIAALVAATPIAFAAQSASGTVKAFDSKAMTLTLNDNQTYMLPNGFKDPGLKPGTKVNISWDQSGTHRQAEQVTITK